jgi:hypothetical protein
MSEDVSRLPKWAQSKISILEREISRLKMAQASFFGEAKSRVKVELHGVPDVYLPDGSRVTFLLDNKCELDFGFALASTRRCFNEVTCMATELIDRHLVVTPHVSNVVTLALVKDGAEE